MMFLSLLFQRPDQEDVVWVRSLRVKQLEDGPEAAAATRCLYDTFYWLLVMLACRSLDGSTFKYQIEMKVLFIALSC